MRSLALLHAPARCGALRSRACAARFAACASPPPAEASPTPVKRAKQHRLDATLSRLGYCSRNEAAAWCRAGRVTVRGARAAKADTKAALADVAVDGVALEFPYGVLLLMNKPAGVVCSHDEREGPRVFDLLPERWRARTPALGTVGRLDKDTTGALLLTDLGDVVQRFASPKKKVPKVYETELDAELPAEAEVAFADGRIVLDGAPCAPAELRRTGARSAEVTLMEGKYHQVKRMFASQRVGVVKLHRSRFGDWGVEGLAPGEFRVLPLPAWTAAAAEASADGVALPTAESISGLVDA